MTRRPQGIETRVRRALEAPAAAGGRDFPEETVGRLVELVRQEVARERQRCLGLCRHRAELWEKTSSAQASAPEHARDEARSRRNEAQYLADLIETEAELYGEPDA